MMPLAIRLTYDIFSGLRVEAVSIRLVLEDLADDDGTVLARVDRDLAGRISAATILMGIIAHLLPFAHADDADSRRARENSVPLSIQADIAAVALLARDKMPGGREKRPRTAQSRNQRHPGLEASHHRGF